jgi:curved DNA-binding protein CbpA
MTFNVGAAEQHRVTLALGSDFGEQELRTAYRSLIRRWHPDFFIAESQAQRDATEKAKTINVAYEFLSEVLEEHGGRYAIPGRERGSDRAGAASWGDVHPRRSYEGKPYSAGFPDPAVMEIFLKASHIISTAHSRTTRTLYIKFTGNVVYRYFGVTEALFEEFLNSRLHGKFAHRHIYSRFRQERC